MTSKAALKMARELLDRFFLDAEGKTNRQIDVFFTLEDLGIGRDKAEEALEFLTSRGLVNMFGPDFAFLTDLGVAAIRDDQDLSKLPKALRDFASKPGAAAAPAPAPAVVEDRSPPPSRRPRPERPRLCFTDADEQAHVVELGAACSIGRVEGNTIHLADQRASKRHAELTYEDGRYLLRDLGAANGTMVNGAYIDTRALVHGDEILIGRTTLVFEAPAVIRPPADAAAAAPEPRPQVIVPPIWVDPRPIAPKPASLAPSVQGIKVVRGRPDEAPRPKPSTPIRSAEPDDLFDTFRPQAAPSVAHGPPGAQGAHRPRAEEAPGDLFAASRPERAGPPEDLFGGDSGPVASRSGAGEAAGELFGGAARGGPAPGRRSDDLFAEDPPTTRAPAAQRGFAPQTEPLHGGGLFGQAPGLYDDAPGEAFEATILRPATGAPADAWTEATPADVAVDVSLATGDLESSPEAALAAPTGYDPRVTDPTASPVAEELPALGADALIGDVTPAAVEPLEPEALRRWDEAGPADEPRTAPGLAAPRADVQAGEDLPSASVSLADATPALVGQGPSEPPSSTSFQRLLVALHESVREGDLPDRDAVLDALELLLRHPYVAAVAARLGRDG